MTHDAKDTPFSQCDIRGSWHEPNTVKDTYGTDNSRTITYRFNTLGFRGEDYDPDAKFRICLFGESCTFGLGVAEDQTFGYRLKGYIAEVFGYGIDQVNLMNMGVAGVSADHCVRSVIRQIVGNHFDLVICHLPELARREYFDGKRFRSLVIPNDDLTKERLEAMPAPLLGFCEMYNIPHGHIDYVKNMLLLQGHLKSMGTPYLISTQHMPPSKGERVYIEPFYRNLDPTHLHHHRWFVVKADKAADGRHAGPRSHTACAITMLQAYGELLGNSGDNKRSNAVLKHARQLKRDDLDWGFCKLEVKQERLRKKAKREQKDAAHD